MVNMVREIVRHFCHHLYLRRSNKRNQPPMVKVSYKGYPAKFNAWIPKTEYDAVKAEEQAIREEGEMG